MDKEAKFDLKMVVASIAALLLGLYTKSWINIGLSMFSIGIWLFVAMANEYENNLDSITKYYKERKP